MYKNCVNGVAVTILAGTFLFISSAAAQEDYDVKAFGPKHQIVWEKPVKTVFEHRVHTDELGFTCDACHGELFAMQRGAAPRTGKFNMNSLAEGKFCGACHDGSTAFATDTNCTACHLVPQDPIIWTKPVKAVIFNHQIHTDEYGLECDSCHNSAFTMKVGAAGQSANFTMMALYDGQYCGACHDGETAFASNTQCNSCHIGVKGYNRRMGVDPHAEDTGGH